MNKCLVTTSEIYKRIPGLILITGIVDLTQPNKKAINEYLHESWYKLRTEVLEKGYRTQPLIAQWRSALTDAGIHVKHFAPSIEAIAKRTINMAEPFRINPFVDAYNAISMNLILPLGAYDVDELSGNLQLRTAKQGESFSALGGSSNEPTIESEIIYADDCDVLTRQFLWRQSEKAKITENTKQFLFVCELLESMGSEVVIHAEKLIKTKFKEFFNVEVKNFTIDKELK
jgi:DNA/RNA-binding domain of Phe-tRNA-synthetase-like protein